MAGGQFPTLTFGMQAKQGVILHCHHVGARTFLSAATFDG